MIWNNEFWNIMKMNNMIEKYSDEFKEYDYLITRYEMTYLNESIDKYENIIIFIWNW